MPLKSGWDGFAKGLLFRGLGAKVFPVPMLHSTSRRDLVVVLLIAVGAHVGLFFVAAAAVANDLIKGKVEKREKEKKKPPPPAMQMVYEEEFFAVPELVPDPVAPVVPKAEPEIVEVEKDPEPAFVQTKEDQEVEEAPEDTNLIGERSTQATSEAEAVAGEEKMTSLAGDEERKQDPKTFDSRFSSGDQSGPAKGASDSVETGKGPDQANQEMVKSDSKDPGVVEQALPELEEQPSKPKPAKLPTIENALAELSDDVGDDPLEKPVKPNVEKVEENLPERPAQEKREASDRDGGFAPRTKKTRVAGVISARGDGSLDVADTAIGRYQAQIFKKLESAWQMENIRNRSLLAPGNITLYFVVNDTGKVSNQRQVAMAGASGTQWGMILRALNVTNIPKMPKKVIKELEGDPLEIIVTFNY